MIDIYIILILIIIFYYFCLMCIWKDYENKNGENMTGDNTTGDNPTNDNTTGNNTTGIESDLDVAKQLEADQITLTDRGSNLKTVIYNEDFTLDNNDITRPKDIIAKYATSDHDFGIYNEDYQNKKENV